MLVKVANDSIARCWSITKQDKKLDEMDWTNRQRAMFLLGLDEEGFVTGMNIVGQDATALRGMFHGNLVPILEQQCLRFQELRGFSDLMDPDKPQGAQVILNAMRSLLLLDGTASSVAKVYQLDSHPRNVPARQCLKGLTGQERGYVLTGDNITKMMFALYRIRCGLPVIVFGEAGVGKSALFRFMIETLLGHTFQVCNVNSGTTILDVEQMIESAIGLVTKNPNSQVFLFFDEMNTADPPVIAFFKELMLDRHCHGRVLPNNLYLMAAANPYRYLREVDKEAAVGLSFRFAQPANGAVNERNLVYRVNELPLAFYDHIYDFGQLSVEAEETYINEISQSGLSKPNFYFPMETIKYFSTVLRKSHKVAREMSNDPQSAVSLRDASRAVQLFNWFCFTPAGRNIIGDSNRTAFELTIYLVYAFRFREREKFLQGVFGLDQAASKNMKLVSYTIARKLYEQAHGASIGSGAIALNDALCENLFALYVCILNGIFLIIVGRPGSSKSLSVEILKLVLSPGNHGLRSALGDLPAVTEVYFQCSPLSTSSGFKALFDSARRMSVDPKTMFAMVVLDELGLADLSPEKPIKVLHSELERQSILTSGEEQQTPFSVVALSNWVVDAAQVNRGILITRTKADKKDLLTSASQLSSSLVAKHVKQSESDVINSMLKDSLERIVNTYQTLDEAPEVGGGHYFSMRDFFFCVKNFVCSVFDSIQNGQTANSNDVRVSQQFLIQSAIRNFGGHEKARKLVKEIIAKNMKVNEITIPEISPLDLIVQNIRDSSKPLSVHIARHLMILNRSMIGLQLLSRHVKNQLDKGTSWNVLFGSCFPGDLQLTAVTRKLRQVEQAIRTGGVLILCHADQLFESLYMVLNQQYWAQDDVTMTQIVLGPSIRPIALPSGPFRIIALQDTDVALNRELMSPAILSRFEKHELRPSHLLDDAGRHWLSLIESHPVWLAVLESVRRKKLMYGCHEETFASLALQLQDGGIPMEVDEEKNTDSNVAAQVIWMRAANPMAMIKLERDSSSNPELLDVCRHYRHHFILEGIDDALNQTESDRIVVMTNTLRHLEIIPSGSATSRYFIIQLFEVQTELELYRLLDTFQAKHLADPTFCLIVQYDAVTGPIEQFQLTKYEVGQRFEKLKCRVVFIVHVDPRPVNMHWVFSFGDGWDYCFVDEVVTGGPVDQHRIPLRELALSPANQTISSFVRKMSIESFKSLLLEMLGPVLQTRLASLRSSLGQFYSGVRTALGMPNNHTLLQLLNECFLAQLDQSRVVWNVVDAVNDPDFDSSSSLTEGLWGVFKNKLSNSLAHLLLVSDIWRVCDESSAKLWCDFVTANYPDRLMTLNSSDSVVQIPVGFRSCTRPFGRLLVLFDVNFIQRPGSSLNGPLHWLLDHLAKNQDGNYQEIREAYFMDWFLLRIPPHLHVCTRKIPISKMGSLVDCLFEDPSTFFLEWDQYKAEVISALELICIASFAKTELGEMRDDLWSGVKGLMRNWKSFVELTSCITLTTLASPEVMKTRDKFMQSISSIEVSPILSKNLQDQVKEMPHLWLGLRISKRILLFNPESDVKLPELQVSTPRILLESLIQLVINSVIRPRVTAVNGTRRLGHQADLYALLKSTSSCNSTEELVRILGECPVTGSIVLVDNATGVRCSSCYHPLETGMTVRRNQHWREPKAEVIESLFHHHQKFMFFFERVTELFIQERKDNPHHIQEFVEFLLSDDSRLRVSWRFLTVIVRSILSTPSGTAVIDAILSTIRCNRLTGENTNVHNFMRALLASSDQDARRNVAGLHAKTIDQDLIVAAMTGKWTVKRIGRLALIRHQLSSHNPDATAAVISQWANWSATLPNNPAVTDSLLFFILRFSSAEGDQTRLSILFRHQQIAKILGPHQVVGNYIRNLSPLSLGFDLQSAESKALPFQEHVINGIPVENSLLQHYQILLAQQPNWAPFIARLAYHAADVFQTSNIRLLSSMSSNLISAAEYYLPGIDNHPYWASFNKQSFRWYMCYCGTLNCVGNCGNPTLESICLSCKMALGDPRGHYPRAGVRRATRQDFLPPTGIHVSREPSVAPNWSVRNLTPVVTRFSLLLNSLALMNSALNPRTERHAINHLLLTLISTERKPDEDRRSLIQLLSRHIVVHLDILYQLMMVSRPQLAMTDKFRFGHLLLHKLLNNQDSLTAHAVEFSRGTEAREVFEQGLARLLAREVNIGTELDSIISHDQATRIFRRSLLNNETSHWSYARLVFSDRQSVQLELARSDRLRQSLPFLNLLLDDIWMQKLDALQYLGDAIRFVALVRTVLQGEVTQEDANTMTIRQGLEKISMIVKQKSVILDRGRPVASGDDVAVLFAGFKQLWDRFSQLENTEKKTFLDYFECQEVNINVRPKTVLDQTAPLILIMAGSEQPEMAFCCQLLNHAVQAASSLALTSFIQPHCRAGSGRVRLHCSSAAALSDFDESLYAHVTTEEVDGFIRDHAIDSPTLQLAESFAMAAILGPAGSTIAEDIYLDVVPEFVFKDDVESNNYLVLLERRSIAWKPSPIPPPLQELILSDLEKNRSLAEARSVLVSAITHLQTTTEPLVINKVRDNYISDVLQELIQAEILTERHISIATLGVFNRYLKLQVCHAFGLLKAILFRMNGDDIFGGRIPKGWGTMLPERLAQLTTQKLRFYSQTGGITETLLELVKNVAIPHSVSSELTPDKSLLYAIRQLEGDEWDGIPDDVKMEHLGHVLLISESISP